jgi:hypothetical protein
MLTHTARDYYIYGIVRLTSKQSSLHKTLTDLNNAEFFLYNYYSIFHEKSLPYS